MRNIYKVLIGTSLSAILSSCSFFDVTPQVICSETFYKTEAEVKYGLAGIYGAMSKESFYGNYYSLMYSNIDDLCYFNRGNKHELPPVLPSRRTQSVYL